MALRLKITFSKAAQDVGVFRIEKGRCVIGRDPTCDWVLNDPDRYISRRHCEIWSDADNYYLVDFSTSGVFVDNEPDRIPSNTPLRLVDGMALRLGRDIHIAVRIEGASAGSIAPSKAGCAQQEWPFGDDSFFDPPGAPPPDPAAPPSTPPSAPQASAPAFRASGPGPSATAPSEVECTAFSPNAAAPGERFLVQAALHSPERRDEAASRAQAADLLAAPRAATTFAATMGARVTAALEIPNAAVDLPVQQVTWRGDLAILAFWVDAPAQGFDRLHAVLGVYIDGVPVGRCAWSIVEHSAEGANDPIQAEFQRYHRAFLSYSSSDRIAVLNFAQTLKALRIDFFQDLLSLEPGDRFAKVIADEIERCDLFVLFWSSAAKASDWVIREAEAALAARAASSRGAPDFRVVLLEGPPAPAPPPSLRDVAHLNDYIRYVIDAQTRSHEAQDEKAVLRAFFRGAGLDPRKADACDGLDPETLGARFALCVRALAAVDQQLQARSSSPSARRDFLANANPLRTASTIEAVVEAALVPRGVGFKPPDEAMMELARDLRLALQTQSVSFLQARPAFHKAMEVFSPTAIAEAAKRDRPLETLTLPRLKNWQHYETQYESLVSQAAHVFARSLAAGADEEC